jgi:DNA recombination protein RmuC
MAIASMVLLVLFALCAVAAILLVFRTKLTSAADEAALLRAQMSKLDADLATARTEGETWRSRAEAERETRASAEASASRVSGLETELACLRNEVVTITASRSALQEQTERVPGLESQVAALNERVVSLSKTISGLETQLAEQEQSHRHQVEALTAIRGEIEKDLKNIASDSLRANQATFLELANEVLEKHKDGAVADLDARRVAVEALVSPVREALQACQANLTELEKARAQAYGSLSAELKTVVETQNAVRSETSKLVNALRAAPKTRGRWGEHTLRNVLELAGLSAFCDFTAEQSYVREGALSRPDVVIRLPGGRSIVVDAKASMTAYLDAVDAVEEVERERHLLLHAAHLRSQVKQLAGKSYWDGLIETPDFVVMFVPGDNFYAAAAERDPDLFEFAAAQRVLIVTPATLIALAKAVAYGWRQEKVAENAKRVHDLGRDLYKRLSTMGEHVTGLGKNLAASIRKYNDFIGSLEGSVMPQARRFHELEVEGTATEIAALPPVEIEPRALRSDRDIVVSLSPATTPEAA